MKISQKQIDEIASSTDIVDVISAYTPLRKAGRSFMGRCPFHDERTPSFSVSQEKGVYHCFGCGKSGNVFTFLMEVDNVSFSEAVKMLAEKANIRLEFEDEPYDEDRNQIEKLYDVNRKAAKYFHDNLLSRDGEYAREYLRERGVKQEMLTKFGLGYSLREKDALFKKFSDEYSREELTSSGLILQLTQNEVRDRFRGRLMFPIISESGRVVGFGARKLFDEGYDEAKYVNSPETKVYNKSKILYGLNFAKTRVKETGYAILVEGYMDLISLFQNGFENVVASSGTSLTPLQIKIISRYTGEIVVVYDSDLAGQNASRRALEMIVENNLNVNLVVLPKGEDPDSYIKKNGRESFENLLNKRQSVINYIAGKYSEQNKFDTPEGKAEFVKEIISLISKMKDEIKRDFYIKDISERFSIYESIIRRELEKQLKLNKQGLTREPPAFSKSEQYTATKESFTIPFNELKLIRSLENGNSETFRYLDENLENDFISSNEARNIINYLMINRDKPIRLRLINFFNEQHGDSENSLFGRALLDENDKLEKANTVSDVKGLIITFKIDQLNKLLEDHKNKFKTSNVDSDTLQRLQKEQLRLLHERDKLQKLLRAKQ